MPRTPGLWLFPLPAPLPCRNWLRESFRLLRGPLPPDHAHPAATVRRLGRAAGATAMTVAPHTMTQAAFEALALGGGGESVVRQLVAAQRSKHLLLIRAVLDSAGAAGRQRLVSAAAYDLLAR